MEATIFLSLAVTLAFIVFAIQVFDARADYNAGSFIVGCRSSEWWLHNDEKTILPEARALYLRNINGSKTDDVGPWPISAAFGIASTTLNLAGFYLFGFNPAGFRFFYIFAAFLANLFCIGSLFILFAPLTAFLLSLFITLNYRGFLAGRHAYPENILALLLSAALSFFLFSPGFFLKNICLIAFFAASAVLIKQNFTVYICAFLAAIVLFFNPSIHSFGVFFLSFAAGTVFFEILQSSVFFAAGTLKFRWHNLVCLFTMHLGKKSHYVILKNFPEGIMTSFRYLSFFMDWFEVPFVLRPMFRLSVIFLIILNIYLFIRAPGAANLNGMLICTHIIFLCVSSLMFFYLKRAYSWFHLTFITAALICAEFFHSLNINSELAANLSIAVLLIVFLSRQIYRLKRLGPLREPYSKSAVSELENLIPSGLTVYAHCFSWRYFWHSEKIRFKSCDDQVINNEGIIDWALKEKGEYILLTSRDTGIDALKYRNVKYQKLKTFHPSPIATDYPESYMLCRIIYD